jgi:hypothetical protein
MKKKRNFLELAFSLEMNGSIDNNVYGFISSLLYYGKIKNKVSKKTVEELFETIIDFNERGFFNNWFKCPSCKLEYMWEIDQVKLLKIVNRSYLPEYYYEELDNKEFYTCIDCDKINGLKYSKKEAIKEVEFDKKNELDLEKIISDSIDFAHSNIKSENDYLDRVHVKFWLQTINSYVHYENNPFILFLEKISESKHVINETATNLERQNTYENFSIAIKFSSEKLDKLKQSEKKVFYENIVIFLKEHNLDIFIVKDSLD